MTNNNNNSNELNTPEALISLLGTYYGRSSEEQARLAALVSGKPDDLVYPVLEQALRNDANANLRNAAMELYITFGSRSLPRLVMLLQDANEEVRTFAAVMLGTMGHREAVPALINALMDGDLNVKHAAAESLGRIRDDRAVLPLIEALTGDMWLQFPAAMALGELADSRAVGPLVALLEVPGANMPAIQALGKIGDPVALGPLGRLLEDEEPSLREWTLEAVAGIFARWPDSGDNLPVSPKASGILLETLNSNNHEAKRNAAITLGCCRIQEALPALSGLCADRDIGDVARKAIARIGRN
jgi:HEAT repeat protein